MQTYVAEIDGRAIFAFRAIDEGCAQAWLDINVAMRRTLAVVETDGCRVWNGRSDIVARAATFGESTTWSRLSDRAAEDGQVEYPDNITVWLISPPTEREAPPKAAARRRIGRQGAAAAKSPKA